MSDINWSVFPKETEKTRFIIILTTFGLIFTGAIIFGFYCLFVYLQSFPYNIQTALLNQQQEEEISDNIKQFGIKIAKIEVLAPVIKEVDGTEKTVYNKELENGAAHYKGTALPGEKSNIFIFGHSSAIFGTGEYAEIFARLGELEADDEIIIYYENNEYEYYVFEKKVVEKTELSVLMPTEEEQLTLMTCWPIGSNVKRLIIKAEPKEEIPAQISFK